MFFYTTAFLCVLFFPSLLTAQLTGTWAVTPYHTSTARYYITQTSPTSLIWLGDSNTGAWKNLANGTISGNNVTVNWRDPPPGTNAGVLLLTIQADGSMVVVAGSGFDIGAVFRKQLLGVDRQISGAYAVLPYHTSTALYYITQDSASTLRWYGDSNNGGWRNIASGVISGNIVTVTWVDIAPSTNKGVAQLRINDDGTLTTIGGTGFDVGSVFAQPGRIVSGVYSVSPYHTPSARYYITVAGNSLTWLGDSNTGAWRNLATGTISNGFATVNWQDPPPGSNSGQVTLRVNADRTLTVVSGSGFDINSVFTRQIVSEELGITGTYEVVPYHTASARYYITQTSATTIVWLGLSNNGGWRNTGNGTISFNKNILKVTWIDIPPSTNRGEATFLIQNRNLIFISGTGFTLNSIFSFAHPAFTYEFPSLSGNYQVTPYHTPSARYYISQTSPTTVVWLGDSNTGAWRNTATGTITDNVLTVNWQDPPPGTNSGQVQLKVNKDGTLKVFSGSGFDINAVFSKVGLSADRRITGTYTVVPYHTSTALYYITQTADNQVVWYGNSNNGGWRNTASGTITGNTLSVKWVDFPPSTNNGQTVLNINPDGTLTVVSGTGFDIGAVFAQIDQVVSGPYSVSSYHTASALYYITKVGSRLVWYGDSNNGQWRNIGNGFTANGLAFVEWKDFLPSTNQGSVVLKINADRTLTTLAGTGFDISSKFLLKPLSAAAATTSVTGPYQVAPYRASSAVYYVTQTSDNALIWLALSNDNTWTSVGKGTKVNSQWTVTWAENGLTKLNLNNDRTLTVAEGSGFDLNAKFTFSASGYYSPVTGSVLAENSEDKTQSATHTDFNGVLLPYWAIGLVVSGCAILIAVVIVLSVIVVKLNRPAKENPYVKY